MTIAHPAPSLWTRYGKRPFDIVVAVPGLILLLPVLATIAGLVAMTSSGPVLFRQTRIGRHEQPFTLLKFRTMVDGTMSVPTHAVAASATTPLGRILRRFKLDEFPQLWNVITGDMSLVGPRPCLNTQTELIEARRRHHVFRCRPGMTGLAQVSGFDMRWPRRLARVDGIYARRSTMALDVWILLRTVLPLGHRRRATSVRQEDL